MCQLKFKMFNYSQPLQFQMLLLLCLQLTSQLTVAAPYYRDSYSDTNVADLAAYPSTPNEVLPIQPVLIYPQRHEMLLQARTLDNDEPEIIYVKVLRRQDGYRPKQQRLEQQSPPIKERNFKDIFYVKAKANGQFSHERLKVYRLPEFYAISVFRNGDKL